ncbi:MAG: acetate/propionate family kinase [Hyphomicrobium sp.]|uniref:acetate/propionate family kinase n=1 Tax=Hyphomicrobium sp. TaxID=82 RepID=UPI0025B7ADDC|nr:acetate/propionate family kinase [Hyphomicrobium sp.]MBZ0209736.1 acetate/propionate family kinase [Hyphomicrobium sp.]
MATPQTLQAPGSAVLVINSGSSSVKFAVFATDPTMPRLLSGIVDRIGLVGGRFEVRDETGKVLFDQPSSIVNHKAALFLLIKTLGEQLGARTLSAVGHRIVHGGANCDCPLPVTKELEVRLQLLVPLAPLHLPHNLAGIAAIRELQPDLPQVACFDTAFHHSLPRLARLTTLPREFQDQAIRRYGFHGLSYEYIVDALRKDGVNVARERILVAHLGNGASMCALKDGRSVETTMGFSTLAGLMMGTRSGDLDPGVLLYLLMEKGMSAEAVQKLLYERSGLLGVSGASSDMRQLLSQDDNPAAAEAIDLFCYRARQHLAALTAALGGLDRLVFTGGIGANAPEIRARICDGLAYLGITLDRKTNLAGDMTISPSGAAVTVQAVHSDEEVMIARHVIHLCARQLAQAGA